MSLQEASEQYSHAYRLGQKHYRACVVRGEYPYPQVLDEVLDETMVVGRFDLGLVDIPAEQIVGTKSSGRKAAFAGNFMPLLPESTEFAAKWIALCSAHLGDEGIRDPIKCCEYMGRFYVQEGNKRVSVLKSYDSPTIPGYVTRIVPEYSDDPSVQNYYEFMHFYQLSGLYQIRLSGLGSYARLQAALGFAQEQVWTQAERRSFIAGFTHFRLAFDRLNTERLDVSASDALLVWLRVFSFAQIKEQSAAELAKSLATVWSDIKNLEAAEPVAVLTAPEEHDRGIISKLLSVGHADHINAAFIYAFDPQKSAWTRAHVHGQEYLERALGDKVSVRGYYEFGHDFDKALERAAADGAEVIVATTPQMISASRKLAALHPDIKVLNCSLPLPYTGVRTYYSRIYESKFITGAIAGAMAEQDTIGYVASYPIVGVPAAINAFALGARLTNPRSRIKLRWTCTEGDPLLSFIDQGITVISNRDATNSENEHWALEWGTYKLQHDGGLLPLAVPCWDWGRFYEQVIVGIFNGAWDAVSDKSGAKAINYWWGMSSGVIDVQLSDAMPEGVRKMAEILRSGIISGSIDPFYCKITDRSGAVRNDGTLSFTPEEIINMDWLCDSVDGSIPSAEELRPESLDMVRLLGLFKNEIPPVAEEETQL